MQPLVVDLMLLRAAQAGGDLRITPGRGLMARVVQAQAAPNGKGLLSIAGELLEAELPKQVKAGDELRLTVRHVSADKVELSITDPRAQIQTPPPPSIPLPGAATLTVREDDESDRPARHGTETDTHALSLRYETQALGAVDLRFVLDPESLKLKVTLAPGRALDVAGAEAEQLRTQLAQQLKRSVEVIVAPRRDPLDLYA